MTENPIIKIDDLFYTVTIADADLLVSMEAALCGGCTKEGLKEFSNTIKAVRDRAIESVIQFDTYYTT